MSTSMHVEDILHELDRNPSSIIVIFRDHVGKKSHFDLIIGRNTKCLDFFSTRLSSTKELLSNCVQEYLKFYDVRDCNVYDKNIGTRMDLSGQWKGQYYIITAKGIATKKVGHHSFDIVITEPKQYKNRKLKLWAFPGYYGRQWVIK